MRELLLKTNGVKFNFLTLVTRQKAKHLTQVLISAFNNIKALRSVFLDLRSYEQQLYSGDQFLLRYLLS